MYGSHLQLPALWGGNPPRRWIWLKTNKHNRWGAYGRNKGPERGQSVPSVRKTYPWRGWKSQRQEALRGMSQVPAGDTELRLWTSKISPGGKKQEMVPVIWGCWHTGTRSGLLAHLREGNMRGGSNILEQVYLKLPLRFKFRCISITSSCFMVGNLLVTWVQSGPAIRCAPMHLTVSLVIATMDVKTGKVTRGEDMVNCGAGWAEQDLTACLKESALTGRKADSVPQRNYTRWPKETISQQILSMLRLCWHDCVSKSGNS